MEVGEPGISKQKDKRFHPSVKLCKRIYPHMHNMDGFFVCKLRKFAEGVKSAESISNAIDEEKARSVQKLKKKAENAKKKEKRNKKKRKINELKEKKKAEIK